VTSTVFRTLAISLWLGVAGHVEAAAQPAVDLARLRAFLQQALDTGEDDPDDLIISFSAAAVDLNGDGAPEYVVRLMSGGWCGSGGCNTWVLTGQGKSFRVVTEMTIVQLPIRVLNSRVKGWRTLAVHVGGGGVQAGYEASLEFDGKSYPSNPSIAPARPAARGAKGQVLIDSKSAKYLLFP